MIVYVVGASIYAVVGLAAIAALGAGLELSLVVFHGGPISAAALLLGWNGAVISLDFGLYALGLIALGVAVFWLCKRLFRYSIPLQIQWLYVGSVMAALFYMVLAFFSPFFGRPWPMPGLPLLVPLFLF